MLEIPSASFHPVIKWNSWGAITGQHTIFISKGANEGRERGSAGGLTAEAEDPAAVEDALQGGQRRGHGALLHNHMGHWWEEINSTGINRSTCMSAPTNSELKL